MTISEIPPAKHDISNFQSINVRKKIAKNWLKNVYFLKRHKKQMKNLIWKKTRNIHCLNGNLI